MSECVYLEELVKTDGHPVAQHPLHHSLRPARGREGRRWEGDGESGVERVGRLRQSEGGERYERVGDWGVGRLRQCAG